MKTLPNELRYIQGEHNWSRYSISCDLRLAACGSFQGEQCRKRSIMVTTIWIGIGILGEIDEIVIHESVLGVGRKRKKRASAS